MFEDIGRNSWRAKSLAITCESDALVTSVWSVESFSGSIDYFGSADWLIVTVRLEPSYKSLLVYLN